jgi:hypothetical protein
MFLSLFNNANAGCLRKKPGLEDKNERSSETNQP